MDYTEQRQRMVERDLIPRGISNPAVLEAMRTVPRHQFVTPQSLAHAYDDDALALPEGQTISQPYIVAFMAEQARIQPTDRVLEVGTGSGYAAAVFSQLCRSVYSIERHRPLAEHAAQVLADYPNVHLRFGDGMLGWPERAPFDAILIAAAGPEEPQPLLEQLTIGGRLLMPLGAPANQKLVRVTRTGRIEFTREELLPVRFVPLLAGTNR